MSTKYVVNWPARLEEMAAFVGLSAEDRQLIQDSAPIMLKYSDELTGAVYDNFLKFPSSRRFFVDENGEVDEERLDRRKHRLARWFRGSLAFDTDEQFAVSILAMGISHSHPPTHRAHLGPIPSRQMIGTMSFIQTAVGELLRQQMADTDLAFRTSMAWNKMLMLQMDILMAGYLADPAV